MSFAVRVLAAMVLGYLLGSIPVGYIVGRLYGVDVRRHGSGRTGGTNVWRATGLTAALITVLGDIVKGVLAVWLARVLFGLDLSAALAGAMAVIGHNWSVFLNFRGGAGGITSAAGLVALDPIVGGVVTLIALLALYVSRYASVGTMTASAGGLIVVVLIHFLAPFLAPTVVIYYSVIVSAAVLWSLRPNIRRLAQGNERRITLW
ncbi:MAG: glycerol-3-phosphate 1-O-acyltransferase PlsY [Nitrospiraceae bacterium]|nr:glycerol-3-phosphate 1-O-acyltransferase PlsY [Nitrospiraceae bacterium]